MVDFHSHFLPSIDDGSPDVDTSLKMLKLGEIQGVSTFVATPHYYLNNENIDSFLTRRDKSFKKLIKSSNKLPQIFLGSEVAFFANISKNESLEKLCIGDSKCLLLEMPFCEWREPVINEVLNLIHVRGITPLLAHVERYFQYDIKMQNLSKLLNGGAFAQMNAKYIINHHTQRYAIKLIKKGYIHVLGSDSHNIDSRPPNLGKAFNIIEDKLGKSTLIRIDNLSLSLISKK